jgi:hypothetical protein
MSNLINDSYLGLAYISVAKNYDKVKWFVGIFAIENSFMDVFG